MLPSPPRPFHISRESHFSPPQSNFEPQLPAVGKLPAPTFTHVTPVGHSSPLRAVEPKTEDSEEELSLVDGPGGVMGALQESFNVKEEQDVEGDLSPDVVADQSIAISQRISEGGKGVPRPFISPRSHQRATSRVLQLLYTAIALVICGTALYYKTESAPIGYCDSGSRTNDYLEELRGRRSAVESCNRENRTLLYSSAREGSDRTPCPLPPLLPLPHPDSCAPCPEHATCSQYSVVCDVGYLLHPHPLLSFLPASASARNVTLSFSTPPIDLLWKVLSVVLDGLPGFGSVALPPRCVEDPKRKRNIGALGKAIELLLGQERGHRLCAGGRKMDEVVMDTDGGDAKKWGVELEKLRDVMKKKTPVSLV